MTASTHADVVSSAAAAVIVDPGDEDADPARALIAGAQRGTQLGRVGERVNFLVGPEHR